MPIHKYIERVRIIDNLIRKRATGSPKALAKKLGISRSHVFNLINEMKEEGFPIAFSKKEDSYCYTSEGNLVKHLFENDLTPTEMKAITGGKSFFKLFAESNYIGL